MFGSKRKDAAFFDAFAQHAAQSVVAAKLFAELVDRLRSKSGGAEDIQYTQQPSPTAVDEETRSLCRRIKSAETAGDKITHETVKRLRENWITPLDRLDIHNLISRMDDVLDCIEAAAERVLLFDVHTARPEACELADILVQSCEAVALAVGLLHDMSNAPQIRDLCVEINRLENAADAVHRKALADLFKAGNDPLMVMKWRDIFDNLEDATDRCEDVANIVEGVVLEYS